MAHQRTLTDQEIHEQLFDEDEQSDVDVNEDGDEVDSVHPDECDSDDWFLDLDGDEVLDGVGDPGAVAETDSRHAVSDNTWLIQDLDQQDHPPSNMTPTIIVPRESLSLVTPPESLVVTPEPHDETIVTAGAEPPAHASSSQDPPVARRGRKRKRTPESSCHQRLMLQQP